MDAPPLRVYMVDRLRHSSKKDRSFEAILLAGYQFKPAAGARLS
jgi:hypothetical protein